MWPLQLSKTCEWSVNHKGYTLHSPRLPRPNPRHNFAILGQLPAWRERPLGNCWRNYNSPEEQGNKVSRFMSKKGGSGTKLDVFTHAEATERQRNSDHDGGVDQPRLEDASYVSLAAWFRPIFLFSVCFLYFFLTSPFPKMRTPMISWQIWNIWHSDQYAALPEPPMTWPCMTRGRRSLRLRMSKVYPLFANQNHFFSSLACLARFLNNTLYAACGKVITVVTERCNWPTLC